ncbi:MAG: zinc ABC transporter substrate-binding protein [Microscillaceae bacterium]|jgi:manganese/zinc/iron transport system substrate-binding protein|nr:zinc ABC transporter substrate-binding protein [Microscillaceae bacterium]
MKIKKTGLQIFKVWLIIKLMGWLGIVLYLMACESQSKATKSDTLQITCTTGMIADAVQNIVGNRAKVVALMGVGVDPHLYKATPKDLNLLRQADIVFYNGLHLEGKMAEILEKFSQQKNVLPIAEGLPTSELIRVNANTYDPHIWFDVALWRQSVVFIRDKLIQKDAKNADFYRQNAEKYLAELQKLHQEIGNQIAQIPENQRVLITAHDAFAYFGKAYKIQVRGLQGISTLAEFGLKDITELVNFIVKRQIKAVFVESSIPKKSLEAVVEGCKQNQHAIKIGGTLYSDAMGAKGSPEGTYIGMVKANVKTIVDNLR